MHLRAGTKFGFDTAFVMRWEYTEPPPPPPGPPQSVEAMAAEETPATEAAPASAPFAVPESHPTTATGAMMTLFFTDGTQYTLHDEDAVQMLGICVANSGMLSGA